MKLFKIKEPEGLFDETHINLDQILSMHKRKNEEVYTLMVEGNYGIDVTKEEYLEIKKILLWGTTQDDG